MKITMNDDASQLEERFLAIGIGVFFAVEAMIIGTIMLAVGASPAATLGILALVNGLVIGTLMMMTWLWWRPWQRRYPAQPVLDDGVSRTWQSFAFGTLARYNHCLRLTADSQHLHVHPFIVFRWFGAKTISLPWDEITDVKTGMLGMTSARINGRKIVGPDWAMKLAA